MWPKKKKKVIKLALWHIKQYLKKKKECWVQVPGPMNTEQRELELFVKGG